jgi:hypothetical protein
VQEQCIDKSNPEVFVAVVAEFGSNPSHALAGATVVLLDSSGQPTTISQVSDTNGMVAIPVPSGEPSGFRVSMSGYKDTYQFGQSPSPTGKTLWIVTDALYNLLPALTGLAQASAKGILVGAVYWVDGGGKEQPVGCARVQSDGGGEARYFEPVSGLPATLTNAPMTSKDLSYFLVANIEKGKANVKAILDPSGVEIGSVDIYSVPGAICINNIYALGGSNPTPSGCPH